MAKKNRTDVTTEDEIQQGVIESDPQESTAEAVEIEDQPRKRLDALMRKVLARRDEMRATQQKLRDIEVELRQASTDKKGRFERMREAALEEYRRARTDAVRTRNQLLNTLRMLPSRS